MKAMDLLIGLGGVEDAYVAAAEEFRQGKHKAQNRQLSAGKIWLIAAVVALMLLLVGCAVVYALRLQDRMIGESTQTREEWIGPSGEYVPPTQWISTELSLQGYTGSPEQLALREWLDFKEQYDPGDVLLKENNMNESGVPEQYFITYDCYTFEMMDKLQEILDKYQLKPLGAWLYFSSWEEPLFYKALQIDSLCQSGVSTESMAGYFSPEGSFHAEFRQTLADEQTHRVVTYTYAKSRYFYPYHSVIRNIELWEQWHYTTSSGTDVLLAAYENALVIIGDCETGSIYVTTENDTLNVPYGEAAEPMTRQKAEKIADSLNFGISPQPCDPARVEAMRADYPEPEREKDLLTGFRMDPETERWFPPDRIGESFENYIAYLLNNANAANNPDVDQLDYCVTDLNHDGQPEILLRYRDTGIYREILEMADHPDAQHLSVSIRFINGYLYEGPVFERIWDQTKWDRFIYYAYKDSSWKDIACLRFDSEAKTWAQSSTKGNTSDAVWETISESEANAIRRSYKPLSLDMKPLSQFNMNG